MCISRAPTRRPPIAYMIVKTRQRPWPRTRKERRANQLGLDQTVTVEYGNWLVRIGRPRAQGRRPLPDASTGTRAFSAFPPNPTATGRVIGSKHPSNRPFLQPCPSNESEHNRAQQSGRNISSRPPSRRPKSTLLSDDIKPLSECVPSLRRVRR